MTGFVIFFVTFLRRRQRYGNKTVLGETYCGGLLTHRTRARGLGLESQASWKPVSSVSSISSSPPAYVPYDATLSSFVFLFSLFFLFATVERDERWCRQSEERQRKGGPRDIERRTISPFTFLFSLFFLLTTTKREKERGRAGWEQKDKEEEEILTEGDGRNAHTGRLTKEK